MLSFKTNWCVFRAPVKVCKINFNGLYLCYFFKQVVKHRIWWINRHYRIKICTLSGALVMHAKVMQKAPKWKLSTLTSNLRGVNKKFVHFINNFFIWCLIIVIFIQLIHCTNFNTQFKYKNHIFFFYKIIPIWTIKGLMTWRTA